MGSDTDETFGKLLFTFCQEFFGSLFMYILFFPIGGILGNSLDGCIFHFLAVILFDILTFGACGNPAVCLALFLTGKMSVIGTFVRLLAEVLVSLIAFTMLYSVIPSHLIPVSGGPELASGIDVFHGSLIEGSIAFVFALTVLLASVYVVDPGLNRPLFAGVIRVLIVFGGSYTGANMNPMIGFSWAWYTNRVYSQEYQIVYSIAPLIGGVSAAVIYHFFAMIYSDSVEADSGVLDGEKGAKKLSRKETKALDIELRKKLKLPEKVLDTKRTNPKSKKIN
mmetsp:Transcript_24910/g.23905  ORF Transcript_24910/g.23905 Transcript_24910/m.23905 type:complete len:280 (+) Transcript_24910:111-950(+)